MAATAEGDPLDILALEPEIEILVEPEPDLRTLLTDRNATYNRLKDIVLARK